MDESVVLANQIMKEVNKVVIGKEEIVRKILAAILAKGHILIEDIPGVGKTTLALAFSKAMALTYHRMQFTPDVLPSDVVGFHIFDKETLEPIYKEGSVFCNLFLADEINRTSAKTQSALLEVMEEGTVTVDSVTREIEKPFTVIATQNPIGSVGTQMLPESQLDRFMIRVSMGYPDIKSEMQILKERHKSDPLLQVQEVVRKDELLLIERYVDEIFVHDAIYEYIAKLVAATRTHELLSLGMSPRGSLALVNLSKAIAFLYGRRFVIPDDIKEVFEDVACHRVLLDAKARINHVTLNEVIHSIVAKVPAPKLVTK